MVDSAAEIDILAIVLRCGPQKCGRDHRRCRNYRCDNQNNQFLLTLWEDFGEIEGHEIASKMATEADLPVILGRSIGISTYQGQKRTALLSCPSEKTSTSSSISPMIVSPAGQQFLSIAKIPSAPSLCLNLDYFPRMGVLYVEREMAILDEFKTFVCLNAFAVAFKLILLTTLSDSDIYLCELGENYRPEDIFDITCTKRQTLSLNHVHELLSKKVFEVQLRKSSWASSNTTHATLSILSYMEKNILHRALLIELLKR
ncbi:hypothetical protein H5410_038899 [Solanum commersonii]|uniref:Uncharacterized protein n=1 Tax=Solanum commersonii TaxID=4109 RepID=A0A9J5YAB6_SOLCO|nr:hypothetical protein H5410_038899 [Solanum commersonii]